MSRVWWVKGLDEKDYGREYFETWISDRDPTTMSDDDDFMNMKDRQLTKVAELTPTSRVISREELREAVEYGLEYGLMAGNIADIITEKLFGPDTNNERPECE